MNTILGVPLLPTKKKESLTDRLKAAIAHQRRDASQPVLDTTDPTPDVRQEILNKIRRVSNFFQGGCLHTLEDVRILQSCLLAGFSVESTLPYDCRWNNSKLGWIGYIHFLDFVGKVVISAPCNGRSTVSIWLGKDNVLSFTIKNDYHEAEEN